MAHSTIVSLRRELGPIGVTLLTLSVLSPGASVLITGGDILHQAGTGAPLAFLLGGVLTLIFTFAQAELGSSFPLAGGDYATIGHTLGPRGGFLQFGTVLLQTPAFIAITALGLGLYVHALLPVLPVIGTAVGTLVVATGIALLDIRTGAALTGSFLAVELATLALLALLGFAHPVQPFGPMLFAPQIFTAAGPASLTIGGIGVAVAAASWATSGAGQAIYFSEEMHAPAKVGGLVMLIVLITIACEYLPVLGVVTGTVDLPAVMTSDTPFTAFLAERATPLIATLVTLGVVAALFNAVVSSVTCYGRFAFSSGRDRIWPEAVNHALVRIHPRFGSPWVATLAVAATAIAACLFSLPLLIMLASGCGIAQWVLLNLAGIAGRRRGLTGGHGTYRAPLFPLTHILSLLGSAALAILAWQDPATGRRGVIAVIAMLVLAAAYHRFVLDRRVGGWQLFTLPVEEVAGQA